MKTRVLAVLATAALLLALALERFRTRAELLPEREPALVGAATGAPEGVARSVEELSTWAAQNKAVLGAVISDLESSAKWASVNPEMPLNPASNQKILTAAAVLKLLGPGYRYTTGVYGAIENGRAARLVLRGHGDPTLMTEDLWRLATALRARGLEKVSLLLVDQSRFDERFVPPAFEQQPNEWASFRAPVSAVALERNAVTLNVQPTKAGQPARYWFEPDGFVVARGDVVTGARGSGQDVRLTLSQEGRSLAASVQGSAAEGLPRLQFVKRVDDPRLYPGAVLRKMLLGLGVEVGEEVGLGGADEKRRIAWIESEPLAVLVRELGKNSDNFYAEMLLKTLAGELKGAPGKSGDGALVLKEWLLSLGVRDQGIRIRNGSGLFDANRVSAAALAAVLVQAYSDPAISTEFVSHLAIAGVDGTLRSRFKKLASARTVRAKTGTLEDVVALSGYALRPGLRRPVAFALVLNGVKGKQAAARQHLERVVERIAEQGARP